MSDLCCWKCGIPGHHRRDCVADVGRASATLNKSLAVKVHRMFKPKSMAEKTKFVSKLSARDAPLLPVRLINPMCVICLFVLDPNITVDRVVTKVSCFSCFRGSSYDRTVTRNWM